MDEQSTIWILATAVGVTLLSIVGEAAKRRAPLAWYAYIPWQPLSFLGVAVALFALVHLLRGTA